MRVDFTQQEMATILLILSTGILVMLTIMTYRVHALIKKNEEDEEKLEKAHGIQNRIYAAIIFTIITIIASIYCVFRRVSSGMQP